MLIAQVIAQKLSPTLIFMSTYTNDEYIAGNESYWETSPMASPSPETMFPSISLSPSPSPFSAPSPFSVFGAGTASDSRSNQTFNSSSGVFLSLSISCFSLLILQLVTLFILK